jgi:hypothetical protein
MHRSGTSLAASWLQLCGLTVDDGRVIGPSAGNLKGHFEDMDFVELHSRTIKRLRPRSGGWLVSAKEGRIPTDSRFDAAAKKLIAQRSNKFNLWGWKDPRASLFLDHWKRLMPELKVILLWRPCEQVVNSLLDRAEKDGENDIPILGAVGCWSAYNKAIVRYKAQYPNDTLLLPVEALIVKDKQAMNLIQSRICPFLQYKAIGDVYDPALLQSRPSGLKTRIASRLHNARDLEWQLCRASDMVV